MSYSLTYTMMIGSGVSTCSTAAAALERHAELLLAGASGIALTHDGALISLIELESLALPLSLARPRPLP